MILKKHILLFSIFIITSSSGQFALPSFQANQSKDNVSPTVVITAAGDDGNSVSSGSTTNDDYITFTMTFSEPVSGFAIGDITSSNGGLTSFSGSGSIYTVRFTPYSNSTGSIVISSGLCIDRSDNSNAGSNTFTIINDSAVPYFYSIINVASDNSTVSTTFNEAVYSTPNGSGSLEVSDFAFTISGGTATLVSATPSSISVSGNTYTLGINLSGMADGTETLTLNPVDDGVYDIAGNEATTSQSNNSVTLNDITPASITGIILAADNSTVSVTFSEAVYNANGGSGALEVSDFAFTISGGTATLVSATPSSISVSGNTYTLGINLSGMADGTETLTLNPVDDGVYDIAGNEATTSQSNNSVTLNDITPASITGIILAADNSTVSVTFSEAVYNANGGSGALEVSDFAFTISGGTATLASATPSSISSSGNTYTLGINLTGTADGNELFKVNPYNASSIYDGNNNASYSTQSNNTVNLNDITPASITGINIASNNNTISVTFNEAVYNTNAGSGSLQTSDFSLALSSGLSTLSSSTPSSISQSSNTYTLGVSLSGVASADQVITVTPVSNQIYDINGSVVSTSQSNNTMNLIDKNYTLTLNGNNEYAAYEGDEPNTDFQPTDWSIQAWVDPSGLPSNNNSEWFVSKHQVYRIGLNNSGGTTKINGEMRHNGSWETLEGTTIANTSGGWYHVVLTFNDSANDLKLYVNGSNVAQNLNFSGSTNNNNSEFTIGNRNSSSSAWYNGIIDEVAFWDTDLSSSAVSALYNSGSGLNALSSSGNYPVIDGTNKLVLYLRMQQNLADSDASYDFAGSGIASGNYNADPID